MDIKPALLAKMTPKEVLNQEIYENPVIITPMKFQSFEELCSNYENIRDLKLLPVKDNPMYLYYKQFDREELANEIRERFKAKKTNIFIERNKFPYWLPDDVRQEIIWIDDDCPEETVLGFIEQIIWFHKYPDYILFERSNKCLTKLVRGTIPQIRHIHLWTKIYVPNVNKTVEKSVS